MAIDPFTEAITETGVVYKTSIQQYSYKFIMKIEKGIIEKKKTTNAKVYLKNAGFQQASAFVDPSTFNWSSRHKKTATVSSKGKITGKSNGIATISAKVEYGNFKLQITVGKNSKKPDKMKISSAKAKKGKKMTLSWKKNSSVTGYQIRYSTNKKFTKDTTKTVNIDKSSKASKTINNLEKGKKYYVQLRAYKKVKIDGKKQKLYGSWSTKKTITAKK